jgi:hypothetical protein
MMPLLVGFLHVLFLSFISIWIWKHDTSELRKFYWPALGFKLLCGILLGILYQYYYTANDTFYFFETAVQLSNKAHHNFAAYLSALIEPDKEYYSGEARTLFFVKITSVLTLLSANNYWISSLYFSFLSFITAWHLSKVIVSEIPSTNISAVIAFLFFPSTVFWSSGLIKESLAMAALFYVSSMVVKIWFNRKILWFEVLLTVLSVWVVWNLKYYYVGLFAPIAVAVLLVKWISAYFQITKFIPQVSIFILVLCVGIAATGFVHPNFQLRIVSEVIVANNKAFVQASSSDDVIHYEALTPNASSLLRNTPWALFSGLYRPFLWEANSIMQGVASVENLMLLLVSVMSLYSMKDFRQSPNAILALGVLLYCCLLCTFLALSSPNFGSLSRYRVGFLPFLVFLLTDNPQVKRLFSG